jgi:hypothetical protein
MQDDNQEWNASMPYPTWPFTRVNPEELKKWAKKNLPPPKEDEFEEAPF